MYFDGELREIYTAVWDSADFILYFTFQREYTFG